MRAGGRISFPRSNSVRQLRLEYFRESGQLCLVLMTSAQNGGRAHACNLRQQMLAATAGTHRFQRNEPASLGLIEPAKKDVTVKMKRLFRMRRL
jgi:hypothetical protein